MGTSFCSTSSWPLYWPQIPFFQVVSLLEICCTFQPLSIGQGCASVPLESPWCHTCRSSCGVLVPLLQGEWDPFPKSIHLFCSNQLCVCQGSGALAGSQTIHTLFPQGGGCAQGPYCTIKRATEVSQVCKASFSMLKKTHNKS